LHLAWTLAEVAPLEGRVLGSADLLPQRLAAVSFQEPRIGPRVGLQHLPVSIELLLGVIDGCDWRSEGEHQQQKGDNCRASGHWCPIVARISASVSVVNLHCALGKAIPPRGARLARHAQGRSLVSAAIPGNSRPSSHSRNAPPAVET